MSESNSKNPRITPDRRRRAEPSTRRPRVAGSRRTGDRGPRSSSDVESSTTTGTTDASHISAVRGTSDVTGVTDTVTDTDTVTGTDTTDAKPTDAKPATGRSTNRTSTTGTSTTGAGTVTLAKAGVEVDSKAGAKANSTTGAKAEGNAVPGDSASSDSELGDSAPADAADDLSTLRPPDGSPAGRKPFRPGPAIWALVAVAAILIGLIVVAALRPGVHEGDTAWVDQTATSDLLGAAKDGLTTVYTYNYESIDQDQENARALLTDDMRSEYDSTAPATKQFATESKVTATAIVDPTAVTLLDGDRAEVLTSVTINTTIDGVDQGFVMTPVAAQFQLVDGQWLISDVLDR